MANVRWRINGHDQGRALQPKFRLHPTWRSWNRRREHKDITDNPLIDDYRGPEVTRDVNEIDQRFGPEPGLFALLAISRGHLNWEIKFMVGQSACGRGLGVRKHAGLRK